jgi:hypothetical protein
LASFVAVQQDALVSSNFCKKLDSARFHQRAFFVRIFIAIADARANEEAAQRAGFLLR